MKPILLSAVCLAMAASEVPAPPHLAIPRLAQAPGMEANADLSSWEGAALITAFGMSMPDDKGVNRWPTTVHVAWGPDAFYVAFEAEDPDPSQVRGFRHKRDDFSGDQDLVGVDIDPVGTGQSCLRLIVTPLGEQMDGIVTDSAGENYSYDCLWDSVGVRTAKGYVVKYRIPYSSVRRAPGAWGLRFLRVIPRERRFGIIWPKPSSDIQCDICQMAKVSGAPLDKAGAPFMVIPFVSGMREQNADPDLSPSAQNQGRLGADIRYSGTAVTLEGTYRPDFNNVDADVDPMQINSRFKVLYSEHRPFFLEGMDLLNITGAQRQFFSRAFVDPLYGIKASGHTLGINWTVLHGKDEGGGLAFDANGASGVDGLPSRNTAAALRFNLDDRGSGISLVGTDSLLLGGPVGSAAQSGGFYVDKWLNPEFHFIASQISSETHLPQADGSLLAQHGTATAAELDWNTRHWSAYACSQATSPGLVLVTGFTDLQGYRKQTAGVTLKGNWNEGWLAQANITLRGKDQTWWNADSMDRSFGFDGYAETAGRMALSFNWDVAGRTWANDRISSNASRSFTLAASWRRLAWAQLYASDQVARTIDLDSGVPARLHCQEVNWGGNIASVGYSLDAKNSDLLREWDDSRLVRGREVVLSGTWQLPRNVYLKVQTFVVRYDGSEQEGVDKFIKALLGWQPNAFTGAYIGWSGQRHRDPTALDPSERMIERGLFAKLAYAMQF